MGTTTKPRDTRPFWRKHLFKLILLPLGAAIAIWFLVIMPRTSKTVDEAFPTAAPAKAAPAVIQPAPQPVATTAPVAAAQPAATTAITVTQSAATTAPAVAAQPAAQPTVAAPAAAGPTAVKSGNFVAVEHDGSGKATIFKQADGTYILRFEDLNVTNGPDLRVRLLGANGASLDLGGLKGNKGNQNYELPTDFDPAKYDTADVWCRAFKVTFNKAALT